MSLQRRLVAVTALLLVIGLAVADVVTYVSVRSFLYGRADDTLASAETLAYNFLTFAGTHGAAVTPADLSRHVSDDVYVLVTNDQGKVIMNLPSGSPTRPDPVPRLSPTIPVQQADQSAHLRLGRYRGAFRPDPNAVVVHSTGDPAGQYRVLAVTVPQGTLFTALSLNPTNDTLTSLRRVELLASVAVLLVMGLLVLAVVRRGLRPLRSMATTADAIASGDLTRRVPELRQQTEVGRLGIALNEMLAQIEGAFTEQSASEDRLRQFVADASHELRTPLTSIRGYAELLRRGGFADETGQRKALIRIEEEATRMGGLVEDLLLLAELDRGRPLQAEAVDLHQICTDVVDDCRALGHDHELTLAPGPRVIVRGDRERLTQVAHNLVRNALAHTPPGTPVTVSTAVEGSMGLIRVADRGPGIPASEASRIFDRFYQSDRSRSRSRGGAGLGLSIVRAIAEALGGSADVTSPPGHGAELTVRIPLIGVARSTVAESPVRSAQGR